jgi:hypothetical protein
VSDELDPAGVVELVAGAKRRKPGDGRADIPSLRDGEP